MKSRVHPSTAGRPTRAQAEARHAQMLDTALSLFLEKGFEQTTIDLIAATVGMTKRTIYAKYDDKAALFRAAVERAIQRYIVPIETVRASESPNLEETLIRVAHIRIANLMTAEGLRLQRVLNSESYRFPEIFEMFSARSVKPTIAYLADFLGRRAGGSSIAAAEPERAAVAFMGMVVGPTARSIVAGTAIAPAELDARIRFSVRLFLDGVLPR